MAVKKHKNLYEKVYDFDNLYCAYLEARRNKRYRDEILAFTANLEENLIDLQNHLVHQTYRLGKYREFYVHEPKKRLIMALPFRDRVVQCALYRIINPLFTKGYISTSYGSIVGGGALNAVKKLQYWLRIAENKPERYYVLKMDIAKFFFRVPHDVQLAALREKIADERVMWLFDVIINSSDTAFGLPLDVVDVARCTRLYDVGMPVGNLISQMLANIVMDKLDQYIKRELRVERYMRYMDDMLILGTDKRELHEIKELTEAFLGEHLRLQLNHKTSVRPVSHGIEYVGYRIWHDRIRLRKAAALRMKRRLRKVRLLYGDGKLPYEKCRDTLMSYIGFLRHCTGDALRDKILEDFVLVRHSGADDPPEDIIE